MKKEYSRAIFVIFFVLLFSVTGFSKKTTIKEVSTMSEQMVFKSEEGRQQILGVYDMVMAGWPVAYEDRFVETQFGKTHLIECGDKTKENIFLFHGSSSNSLMWLADMAELSKDFHVFSVDILGEAGKSDPVRLDLNSEAYANWIAELLDSLNVEKATFIGNSLGGWASLKFATAFPERVSNLVLIAPSGITPVKPSFMKTMMACAMKGPEGMEELNKLIYGTDELPQEVIDFTNLVMANFNPIVEALPLFSETKLQKLNMPILYIAGEDDILFDSRNAVQILEKNCTNVINNVIPDNGHVVYNTMDIVIPFLK